MSRSAKNLSGPRKLNTASLRARKSPAESLSGDHADAKDRRERERRAADPDWPTPGAGVNPIGFSVTAASSPAEWLSDPPEPQGDPRESSVPRLPKLQRRLGSGLPEEPESDDPPPKYKSPADIKQPDGCPQVAESDADREARRRFLRWVEEDED